MEAMTCEDASIYLEWNILKAMDLVAPIENKKVKNKPGNQWSTFGIKTSLSHLANFIVNTGTAKT